MTSRPLPAPSRPTVLVTGAAHASRPRDCARTGTRMASTWQCTTALRLTSAAETVAKARAFRAQAMGLWRRPLGRSGLPRAGARRRRAVRPARRRGEQRLDVRVRRRGELQLRRDGARTGAPTPHRPSCWRRRCTRTSATRRSEVPRGGCVVNLLDQKLWNPNPDYFSYTLSKAALEAATTLLAQALAPQRAGVRRGARRHAAVGADDGGRIRQGSHRFDAARTLVAAGTTSRAPCAS